MNGNNTPIQGGMQDDGMDNDYLWDRSGPVDLEVARLERLLRGYAHADAPRRTLSVSPRKPVARPRRRWRSAFAAAAMLAVCVVGMRVWYQQRLQWDAGAPWQVVAQTGDVRIDGRKQQAHALPLDGTLETGANAMTRLRAAGIGEVAIGQGSRLRLVETRTGRHRVQLEQGSLWARVWAPPGQFGVGVAGAEVIDLGCEFLLKVDADGNGSLSVLSGWVQVDNLRREVLVPQGARVRIHGDGAAGTPHAHSASAAFIAALEAMSIRKAKKSAACLQHRARRMRSACWCCCAITHAWPKARCSNALRSCCRPPSRPARPGAPTAWPCSTPGGTRCRIRG